jgi:hypothetical protein
VANLDRFSQKMTSSGHKHHFVKKVLVAGIQKYKRKLEKSLLPATDKDYKPLHLGTKYNALGRWKEKTLSRNNWYKDGAGKGVGGDKAGKPGKAFQKAGKLEERIQTSTVIFVPSTKGGQLIKMLKDREDELARITKFRVRYQEAGGTKLGIMFSTDLGAGESCERADCQPCGSRTERRPNCEHSLYCMSLNVLCATQTPHPAIRKIAGRASISGNPQDHCTNAQKNTSEMQRTSVLPPILLSIG